MKKLTKKQKEVLEAIKSFIQANGFPPSVREINSIFGFSSPAAAHTFLKILEKKGYIRKVGKGRSRSYEVIGFGTGNFVEVPILGRVAAGKPVFSEENREGVLNLDPSFTGNDETFLLRVDGDSMINANINDGDLVLVKKQNTANSGDIVVALIDAEATVKRFFNEGSRIRLQPENDTFQPIFVDESSGEFMVLGKVLKLIRDVN
ncbi:transcriptional repressor LexA [candidate division KSB1 bacterium]